MRDAVFVVASLTLVYFLVLNTLYLMFTGIAWQEVTRHLRARRFEPADAFASPFTPGVSVLLPAHNEEAGVADAVRSLLALRYPLLEVIVANDGSQDRTLEVLREAFDLVPARKALRTTIPTAPIRGTYASRTYPNLWVLDKENGSKADALNAALSVARHPYVCAVDADSLIEEDALLRVALPMLENSGLTVATGGMVRIVNGCRIEHGRVVEVGLPRSHLARLQVVEYFRAFFMGRTGWSRLNALPIISGAFGLFERSVVEAAGGWWTGTDGDDLELVTRLQCRLREQGEEFRIEFVPDPVCWTEVPEDVGTLARQRSRWQRAVGETLWRHRREIGNPRLGIFGVLTLPYLLVFEFLGPLVELTGYISIPIFASLGLLSTTFLIAFLTVSLLLGTLLSVAALALEEFSFRRHARGRDAAVLIAYAVVENLGFRQLQNVWRLRAYVDLARGRKEWGTQQRKGYTSASQ
jgi:cellulose synthase/poly-beta-1,6-N-acetylglucosamine synthase-like glycosyltransferase